MHTVYLPPGLSLASYCSSCIVLLCQLAMRDSRDLHTTSEAPSTHRFEAKACLPCIVQVLKKSLFAVTAARLALSWKNYGSSCESTVV
jgi:hypothetical protein